MNVFVMSQGMSIKIYSKLNTELRYTCILLG